jgi:hypothetical protein
MDAAKRNKLSARGLVAPGSSGEDSVRVYLQYLPDLPEISGAERGKALRERFEEATRKRADGWVELDHESLSESGQMIEANIPASRYEEVAKKLADEDLRMDIVQAFKAT